MRSCAAKGEGFDDIKLRDAWIGHIGFPSVGKNTLLKALTNAFSEVQEREFSTFIYTKGHSISWE